MMADDATGDDDSSGDDDDDDDSSDALKAAVLAAGRASPSEQDTAMAFNLKLTSAPAKPSPMIQELN